ncbi:MAG: HEAT repeat domain-containing protein [Actinomycetaceae bacterium]|nr:HEAT repeat domain-containing protein [Actinomycetaceae bacterium]
MTERGAHRFADIDPEYLAELNAGTVSSRTLTEALAINHSILLQAVLPNAPEDLRKVVSVAQELGIMKRMVAIGAALADSLTSEQSEYLASHPSDTVRGWACFLLGARHGDSPTAALDNIRPFADDEHFSVREWAWMAVRPALVRDLESSIDLLAQWTADPSERVRRFASEALRPRGVWAAHIAALKEQPELGEPILEPLHTDPSRYVQDSVANWINDAAKTRPDWAIEICDRWVVTSDSPATGRIVKRALRSIQRA